jgi:hypothetical protein
MRWKRMSRLIDDFKNRISSYAKEYKFSQEEVLDILERYEIKYRNARAIPLDKVKQARDEMSQKSHADADGWDTVIDLDDALEILDKLISESEE